MKPIIYQRLIIGLVAVCIFSSTAFCQGNQITNSAKRQTLSLNKGWRFYKGDIAFPVVKGHGMTYSNAKAGTTWGAAAPAYNDSLWRVLNLPHDWAVEALPDSNENVSQGYKQRGIGWYRRRFTLPQSDRGKHLELQFDGVATHCTVWVNGSVVHRNYCGYTSFYIDITPYALYGNQINQISIRVDANTQEGWWYEGAGIYRNTWLVKRSPVHIITDGVFAHPVKTKKVGWIVPVEATVFNSGHQSKPVTIETKLFNQSGKLVQQVQKRVTATPLSQLVTKLNLQVMNPTLWDIEHPVLYSVITTIKQDGIPIDEVQTNCGFRTTYFSADSGFYLNGKPLKLKGTCNHQDHAGVGVAVPPSLWDYRIGRLKEMGSNAYRCAHNPPAKEFLDACDRLGMLVMDENRNFNVSPEYVRQLEWMVRRDRNHPSIILWSVFNEEPMQGSENGYEMVRRMTAVVKILDTSRPVTAAANAGLSSPLNVAHAVDVIGMNYQADSYDYVHKTFPKTPVISSEDGSAYMVRGEYKTIKEKQLHDSYDTQFAPWGTSHRKGWELISKRPHVAGCFIWTGFDYRGEPQPYEWPATGASFGIMDQCGFPKMAFYLHQAQWLEDTPILHLVPHWNWPADSIGKNVKVMAVSNADSVSLWLNDKFLYGNKNDVYKMLEWQVPYQQGKLEARGYKKGKQVSSNVVHTTGDAVAIRLLPYKKELLGNGIDAMPVTVEAIDANGNTMPTANNHITFSITGDAEIIGVGNGNPNSHEPEKGNQRSLYNGLAQLIVQAKENGKGYATIIARAANIKLAEIKIMITPSGVVPFVE